MTSFRSFPKRAAGILLALALLWTCLPAARAATDFSDVPTTHWASMYIRQLRELGVTEGIGNNRFGIGRPVTRAEFTAFICKTMDWKLSTATKGHFKDNQDVAQWYFPYIETAIEKGAVVAEGDLFRPLAFITRADMAVMTVRALGLDALGKQLASLGTPFSDVKSQTGYITIARDLGIVDGLSSTQFGPGKTALREQAAAILIRLLEVLERRADERHGFYAIRSAEQMDAIGVLDSVGFGWSRLELNGGTLTLNSLGANNNEYNLPEGYVEPLYKAVEKTALLMVAVREADSPLIINDSSLRRAAAEILIQTALRGLPTSNYRVPFDGIVVDFEALLGSTAKANFTAFLKMLRDGLAGSGQKLYVAVPPARRQGVAYYDGYDFKAIGDLADRVILMAHDYEPRQLTEADMARGITKTPPAPLDEVSTALRAACDPVPGVSDRSKLLLQISFDTVQWKTKDGKNTHAVPYAPAYDAVAARIDAGARMGYDAAAQSPYITFTNAEDGTDNIVWYEDTRSVAAKTGLADLFGLGGVSWWRLGIIPDLSEGVYLNVLQSVMGR